MEVDCMQMFQQVLHFKDRLAQLFADMGLLGESTRLNDFKTVSMETQTDGQPPVQQMSSDAVLVLQLIMELVHAALVSKKERLEREQREEKAVQTEESPPELSEVPDLTVAVGSAVIKHEKEEDNSDDEHSPTALTMSIIPTSQVPIMPLRKSQRTSVLNRKPFVTPRESQRKTKSPTKVHGNSPTRAITKPHPKPATKLPTKPSSKPTTKPASKTLPIPVGAKKRKLGTVKKKGLVSKSVKKEEKEALEEVEMEEDPGEKKPRRGRRSVLATTMYERTADGKFRCLECGKVAKLQTNIRKHLRKHTGEKPYRCTVCPVAFAYPRSLKRHQLVHEGVRPFKCLQCDKRFFDTTTLRTHSRVHTNDRPFVCQICGNRFRQKEGLKGHMRRHTGDRPYVCERCGMAFAAKRSLVRHIRVHTGERPYSCDQCVAAFADWTTLHNHKLVHRSPGSGEGENEGQEKNEQDRDSGGSEKQPYQCQFCGIRYRQPISLKRHLRLHSANPEQKKPASKKPAKRRMEDGETASEESTALHLQYRPYACELCGEKFKHLRGYVTHKNKHQSGTLTGKKLAIKRLKQEGAAALSHSDIKQAATILASVSVSDTASVSEQETTAGSLGITTGTDGGSAPHSVAVPQHISVPHNSTLPPSNALPHSITIPHSTGECHNIAIPPTTSDTPSCTTTTNLPMSLLALPPQPDSGTVTIIDAATFNSIASEPPSMHLPVSSTPMLSETGDLIQYTSGNVTQVIQYPDGTLSEVTTLVPHPPPPTIIPSSELLDNVVTVVFEARDGSMVLDNQ